MSNVERIPFALDIAFWAMAFCAARGTQTLQANNKDLKSSGLLSPGK